jgi:hypothetical protein
MAKQWTPPSDGLATKSTKFVPPSDAVEVKKKASSESDSKLEEPTLVSSANEVEDGGLKVIPGGGTLRTPEKMKYTGDYKPTEKKISGDGEVLESNDGTKYRYYNGKYYTFTDTSVDKKTGTKVNNYNTQIDNSQRVKTLDKMFNKADYYKGYPGKEDKEYRFKYNQWYEDDKSGKGFTPIQDPVRVGNLNKQFKKEGSTVLGEKVFVGYPGKESNEYKVSDDGAWMYRPKGSNNWSVITNEGSILSLNKQYGQKIDPKKQDLQNLAVKNSELNDINHKIDAYVTSNLIDDREGVVTDVLSKKFPQFNFEQSKVGVDRMTVSLKGSQDPKDRIEIILDNWEDSDDKLNANLLKSFMKERVNMADSRTSLQEKESPFLTRDIESKQRALEAGSGQKEFEQPELVINKDGSVSYAEKPKTTATQKAVQGIEEKQQLKEARQEYFSDKSNYLKTIKNSYSRGEIDNKEFQTAVAAIKVDDKEIKRSDEFVNDVNYSRKKLTESQDFQEKYINDVTEKLKSGEITQEQYDAEYQPKIAEMNDSVEKQKEQLNIDNKSMNGSLRAMERAVAENRLVQEQIGSTGGAIAYNAIKMATDLGRLAGLTPEDQEAFIRDNFGIVTTKEFIGSEDRTFLQKAAMSSASTGVAIAASAVGGAPLALATLWAAGTFEMFDDEEMKDVPKRDRFLMSAAYGVVSSYLEKIGLDELVGGSIGKKLAMNVVKDSAKKLTKDAPKEYIENLLISETKTRLQQAGVKVGVGMLAEGTTEALQSLANVSTKEVYDQLKGTDYFNNKSGWEIASDVLYDGALGAVGGGMISSAITGSQQVVQGRRASKMDTEIQALIAAAETEGMSDAVKTTLKAKIIRGEITKADAINILGDFNIIKSKVDQMPNTLTEEGKAASLDLMLEKDKLDKQIEGKDPNLVEPQKKRVNEINDRLKQIGEDAVQKQTTGEVPVQSETGVSEEVAGGVSQPTTEQVTEEVVGKEVVGEEVKGEQAKAEVAKQEEVVPTEEDNSFVYKMNTEKTSTGKGKWEDDFEIIDNRDGGNLGKESAKWAVTNRITGETVEANSKKDAAGIIKNAPSYGVDMWGDGMTVDFTDLGGKEQNKYREEFDRQKSERVPETKTTETVSSKTQETAPSTESELDFEVTPEVNQEADALEKLLADEGITVESPVVEQPVAEETVVDTSEVSDRDIMEIEDNNENIRTEEDNIKQYQTEAKAKVDKINKSKWSPLRKKNEIAKVRQEYKDKIDDARLSIANNRSDVTKAETRVRKATKTTTTPVTETAPVAETPVAAPARKPKAPKKLTKKETLQKYNDHIDSLIRDEKQTSDRRIVQLENQKNSATRERRTELTQQIQELELNFSSKKRELEGKKGNVEAAVEFVANAPRFRMSEGTQEEADTRNDEQAIVDKMNEASAEEKGLTRGEVPADVEVNPIEESSSLSKGLDKVLKFLGLKDKNSLLKRIEDFNGIPMILGMSDMLAAGTIKDSIGGDMVVDGGLLYNTLGKNVGLAWAGVTEDGANNQVKQARELYEANKELFDRLWAEGKIPNGHVPMAIMRMGNTAVNSNEAVFRYLLPLVKSLPLKNRTAALKTYMQTLQSKAEGNAASYWFTELEEQIGMGNLSTKEQVLDYLNNLAAEEQKAHEESKKEGESAKVKKIKSFINAIKKKKDGQERTFEDIREDLNDRLEKIVPFMLASYIKSNKIKTLDGFLEAVVNESKKRADGDKNIFSLPVRSFIFNSLISPETTKGKNSLEVIKTLLDGVKNADATIFTAKHIYDAIGEKSMLKANKGDVVGVMGIKVVDEDGNSAGGAKKAEHNNYGYGPEGKVIALIKNPKQGIDVFPEFRAKLARVFKPSKTGKYPSIEDAVGQTGGAFFMDAAFRGTAPAVDAMTDLKILIGKLRFAFPEVSVATTQEEFDAFMEKEGVRAREKDGKVIYGVTKDGRIFLNPSEQTLRTPIHEFGHIWIDYLRSTASGKKGDMLLQKGFELVDGTPEYERALKEYGSRELALEEALVELMAVKGDTIISAAKKSQFLEWMNGLFKYIKENLTRSKDFAQTRIKDLTLDEFINIGLADLFSGQKVSGKFDPRTAGGASRARFSKIDSIAKIIDAARKNNVSDQAIKLVLARKGFAVADINDAFNSATQAEENLDATLPGYTELMAKVDAMITRQVSRNIDPAKISKNVDALVRKSDVYKNATDIQKKAIEANTKAKTSTRQTVAPSSGRIIGAVGDIQNLTTQEKLSIASRIMKLAKDASANLSDEIKDLAKSGKITANQMTVIFNRFKSVNLLNERSVNSFIDYMANVFNNADYASKVSRAISLKKKVINNARTKLGIASSLISEIVTMASIKPSVIPSAVFDQYMELMDMLGARQTVLTLDQKSEISQGVSNVLNAVNEEMSQTEALAEQFENYADKELNANGGVDFAKTLKKMIDDGTITEAEAEIMRKYKTEIVDSEFTKKTPEELEGEKKGLLEDLKNKKISTDAIAGLGTRLERDDAESLAALLETDAVNELNNTTLKNVLKLVDNINNGFLPHYAKVIEKKLDGINKSMEMQESLSEGKTSAVSGFLSSIRAGVKTLIGQDSTKEKELIRSTALAKIDEVFGNFKNNAIFKALFQKSAIGIDAYNTELNVLLEKLDKARDKVLRSFGRALKQDPNTFVNSSFKMMTYLLQLEKNSNPDSKQVNNAVDFIKKTQQQIKNDKSTYKQRDSDLLQGILNDFVDADTKQIDIDKLYSSFNAAEKAAIKAIQEVNESMTEKAIYTSAIIRGDKINPILNYISHSVIVDTNLNSDVRGASDVDSFTSSRQVSTRARSLEERTGTVTAISFDPFGTTEKSTKGVLLDFHMTIPYQTAMITLNETRKRMEESKDGMSKKQRLSLNAIESAYMEASKNALQSSLLRSSVSDMVVKIMSDAGYRAILGTSVSRTASELLSNMSGAAFMNSAAMIKGIKEHSAYLNPDRGASIMKILKSTQIGRTFGGGGLFTDPSIGRQNVGTDRLRAKSNLQSATQMIYNRSLKPVKNSFEWAADILTSSPDKLVTRPMWFGSFSNEFKKASGKEVDFDKIEANDEAYMKENADAIQKATEKADRNVLQLSATNNAYAGVLKNNISPDISGFAKAIKVFDNFLTRFTTYEYLNARTAIYNLVNDGMLSKREAAGLLAGVTTRMITYTMLSKMLGTGLVSLVSSMLFGDDDDEEDDKTFYQKLGQAGASAGTTLLLGRNFGNIARNVIGYGAEKMNEEYLTALRNGDYDPYKDAIQFTVAPVEKKADQGKGVDIADYAFNMMGPASPFAKSLRYAVSKLTEKDRVAPKESDSDAVKAKRREAVTRQDRERNYRVPLEVTGTLGFVPLYKDIRNVLNNFIYADLKKSLKEQEANKEKKAEMLMGYESKTDMKDSNPKLYDRLYDKGGKYYAEEEVRLAKENLKSSLKKIEKNLRSGEINYSKARILKRKAVRTSEKRIRKAT